MSADLIMYAADWSFNGIPDENLARISQINYAFGHIKDGRVSVAGLKHIDEVLALRNRRPELRIALSIGGWGADGFSQAVSTADGRRQLADSSIELLRKYDFTGLDWDWEYPTSSAAGIASAPTDCECMSEFLVLMRARLDELEAETGRHYNQSIAVGAGEDRTHDYDWKVALPALDTVNLMTYDMGADVAVHHSNLMPCAAGGYSARQSVDVFERVGIPSEKLLIGAAFYMHEFLECGGIGQRFGKRGTATGFNQVMQQVNSEGSGFERIWDEQAHAACFCDGKRLFCGDDPESLHEKGKFVRDNNLGGVIVWEYGCEPTGQLLSALYEGLQA